MSLTARVTPSGVERIGRGVRRGPRNEKNHLHAHATAFGGTNDRVIIVWGAASNIGTYIAATSASAGRSKRWSVRDATESVLWKRGQIIDPMLVFVYLPPCSQR